MSPAPDHVRRFQYKGGFPDGERYVEVRPDGTNGFRTHDSIWHDTTDLGRCGYHLDYCLEQVRLGHWEEITDQFCDCSEPSVGRSGDRPICNACNRFIL